jgi:hypothetical protein
MGVLKGLLRRVGRLVGIASFTVVEVAALAGWLALVRIEPLGPASEVVGVSLLFAGLFLEGLLTHVTVNGVRKAPRTVVIAAFTATETLLWVGWLALAERVGGALGIGAAGLALAVLLVPQHTVEDNVLGSRSALARLFDAGTIGFSVLEAAGATAWLLLVAGVVPATPFLGAVGLAGLGTALPVGVGVPELVGVGVLAVSLFIEHLVGVRHALRAQPTDASVSRAGVQSISFQQE